jgi:hypothetical protein
MELFGASKSITQGAGGLSGLSHLSGLGNLSGLSHLSGLGNLGILGQLFGGGSQEAAAPAPPSSAPDGTLTPAGLNEMVALMMRKKQGNVMGSMENQSPGGAGIEQLLALLGGQGR